MERIIEIKKSPYGHYQIICENGERYALPIPLLKEHRLSVGEEFSLDQYFEAHSKDAFQFAMKKAAFLLERKDYSRQELYDKLIKSGYIAPIADKVMDYLTERRFIDDERYAQQYVERRGKKVGAFRLRQELNNKGIDRDLADEMIEAIPEEEQIRLASAQMAKYLRRKTAGDERKIKQQAIASLMRKGYPYELCLKAYEQAAESES